MVTYDLAIHLNNLRMLSDYNKSGYTTFEIFMDAVDKGVVRHLIDDFNPRKIKKDWKESEARNNFLEGPSDELLQNLKEIPSLDNIEQYINRIEYEIDQILEFFPDYPQNFKLEELEDIVIERFPALNGFIRANHEMIDKYIRIMTYYPPYKFFEAINDYDLHTEEDPKAEHTLNKYYPQIFQNPDAFGFFQRLQENIETPQADYSCILYRMQKDKRIRENISKKYFAVFLNENFEVEYYRLLSDTRNKKAKFNKTYDLIEEVYFNQE
ncbi:hypothetical protein NE848_05885 [Gramella jeungdoensis]|uniref:Uncharacterized protein n=1 Tax=Gramella jeungdoensis TaxID=708091 RepID=A0ABT0YZL5_9FLAO|nr:hypothetical protein [Gramella jeungdoensis]MCM8568898.1 hypothetical protein [Gramella jeungdoensis]